MANIHSFQLFSVIFKIRRLTAWVKTDALPQKADQGIGVTRVLFVTSQKGKRLGSKHLGECCWSNHFSESIGILIFLFFLGFFFYTLAPLWSAFCFLAAFLKDHPFVAALTQASHSLQQWDQRFHHRQYQTRNTHTHVRGARPVSLRPVAVPCVRHSTQWQSGLIFSLGGCGRGSDVGSRTKTGFLRGIVGIETAWVERSHRAAHCSPRSKVTDRRHPEAALVISHVQPLPTGITHIRNSTVKARLLSWQTVKVCRWCVQMLRTRGDAFKQNPTM